jgi:hypothetical protein
LDCLHSLLLLSFCCGCFETFGARVLAIRAMKLQVLLE